MKMNGKTSNATFVDLYKSQAKNQDVLIEKGTYSKFSSNEVKNVPVDDPSLCSYHVQQLVSEIGEVLEADKRWKNFRNDRFDKELKLDEIADCFIVTMNIAMFSGFTGEEIAEAIEKKIAIVRQRIGDV